MSDWYAIRTASRQERRVAASLSERNFPIFLPMETDKRGHPPQSTMEPLFPGYVFVLCEPEDFAEIMGVEGAGGFVRYIRDDGIAWPAALPASAILGLQVDERAGAFDRTRAAKPERYDPRKGERVMIIAGPYFGFLATVLATPQGERCKLLIQHETFEAPRNRTEDVVHLTAA